MRNPRASSFSLHVRVRLPQQLIIPRARVKRIMKADADVKQIKPESVMLAAKAVVSFEHCMLRIYHGGMPTPPPSLPLA